MQHYIIEPLVTNQTYTSTLRFYNFYLKLLMNKQVKTLNNKKIKYKFSKTNFIAHNQGLSHKGLKPTTNQQSKKASYNRKHKTQVILSNHQNLTFGQCLYHNTTKPSQNSILLYHHNLLILL